MPSKAKISNDAPSKASKKKDEKKATDKRGGNERLMYLVGAAVVGFIALLIGSAHMLKRARRAAKKRRAGMTEDEIAADDAVTWVVSERTIMLGAGGLLIVGAAATVGIFYGQRLRDRYAAMRAAARERAERKRLSALKETERIEGAKARLAAREAAKLRREQEQRQQEAFEAGLRAEIEKMKAANDEKAAAEAQRRLEESQAAYAEARRIEELTRNLQSGRGGGGGGGLYDDDDWDVGEWENAAAYEEGEAGGEGGDEDDVEEEEEEEEEEDEDEEGGGAAEPKMVIEATAAARGTRLALEGLAGAPEQTARVDSMWVQLGCMRCGTQTELNLSGLRASKAEAKAWCEKCACPLSASFRPALLHAGSPLLGHVDTANCTVADVPRLSMLAHCGKCVADCPLPELVRGRRSQRGCLACHNPVWLQMQTVTIERLAGAGLSRGKGGKAEEEDDELEQLLKKLRKKNADQLKSMGLCVGKPLPNKGACAHYKHSYRWLRFPCCGRAHPCAVCHAESDCPAASEGAWANRMLCGKCSREMPYSDKPCEHCGNTFTKPGGAHWQGGDGCRDQRRLDTKDSRKHKGASADGVKKTTSQKNHRVGALGKSNAAAKKLANAKF